MNHPNEVKFGFFSEGNGLSNQIMRQSQYGIQFFACIFLECNNSFSLHVHYRKRYKNLTIQQKKRN